MRTEVAGVVAAVCRSEGYAFSKPVVPAIRLVAGLGVEGDVHAGVTVRHRSRVAVDPTRPNLRQVHLIHAELHEELRTAGFAVAPGEIGENITTRGLDLLGLPRGAHLFIGAHAVVEVTGLRNPCRQLDAFREGLLEAVLERRDDGTLVRKAGIMGVVVQGGTVVAGDLIRVVMPASPRVALECV